MENEKNYQKFVFECAVCRTKFELWIAASEWFSSDFADYLKENFSRFCPVCRALEDFEKEN